MSLRPLAGIAFALLLALAPTACRRQSGPSAEYEEAARRFRELYAKQLDAAYLDPQMGEIEAQLQRVPADSLDAEGARDLLQRIQQGRSRMQADLKARQDAVATAREVPAGTSMPTLTPPAPPGPREVPDAGPPDAGLTGPQAGTLASELVAGFRGCFRRGPPIDVEGRGMRETWELADRTACRLEYPGHGDVILLIEEGRVLTLLPKSAVRTVQVTADGGTAPRPAPADAGR
ncbi:hypothetical protein [Pyxidicoccus xibeiensis]|uniref:hypothetical protein n=1 Tax=Pyxidicoccus xibeiensis TaxID=2906759 RepID=UPI0020A75FC9|nr:hypothetical protein [Pyxidicoccus xibeiensis]MCP3142179.1 hypothetical protein [Pyxidicoccus xibeiensis]